jgi:hypothetical protein
MIPLAWPKQPRRLSAPLVKLIEVVAQGVGAVGGPPLAILRAHCDGRAALIRAGYDQKLRRLQARHEEELRALPAAEPRQLPAGTLSPDEIEVIFEQDDGIEAKRALQTVAAQALKRRANAMAIMGEAADSIGAEVSDQPVNADWAARFFSSAQDVSAAELQKLWGKLLAREVETPGAVPLRTLDILRNMTRSEGALLQRFATYMIEPPAYACQQGVGLSDEEFRLLRDAGILESDQVRLAWEDYKQVSNPPPAGTKYHAIHRSKARLDFPSGHALVIVTFGQHYSCPIVLVAPAAIPLVKMIYQRTDTEYLRALASILPRGLEPRVEVNVLEPGHDAATVA